MTQERQKRLILAVDDNPDILQLISGMLKLGSYDVITANRGATALELAKQVHPDLVILDIDMPDMDGGEVRSCLERDPATANIPVLFLTGIIRKNESYVGMKSGKSDIIAKPVTTEELLEKVRVVFSPKEQTPSP
jgi:CheY-like chemotaxis protein